MTENNAVTSSKTPVAQTGRPSWESGGVDVESRSGLIPAQDHLRSCRPADPDTLGTNCASLSPEGTLSARKIINEGPGSACPSVADDGSAGRSAERTERLRAFAREWAEQSPSWSERKWKKVNSSLGYRLKEG